MLGYGYDESAPTPDGVFCNQFHGGRGELAECSQPISWCSWGIVGVFALYFVGVKETFTKCSQRVRNLFDYIRKMFATRWLSVCYILTEEKGGFCIAKVWFLACKKGVFDGQK
jgi:hypothetical protein